MSTRVYHHDDCLSHDPGATHPESAARILGVLDRLQHAPLASRLDFVAAPLGNVPGNILNVPLPSGTDDAGFRRIFSAEVLPALEAHAPGLLLVSAGFDAHSKDPLASLALETATYRWLGEQLAAVAGRHAEGRLLAVLEGGYELTALADSVLAWLEGSA